MKFSTHCGLQLRHFFNNKSALHCLCTHVELARHSPLSASSPQIATSFDALKHPQLAINKPIEAPIPTPYGTLLWLAWMMESSPLLSLYLFYFAFSSTVASIACIYIYIIDIQDIYWPESLAAISSRGNWVYTMGPSALYISRKSFKKHAMRGSHLSNFRGISTCTNLPFQATVSSLGNLQDTSQ